jgi:hypothetical protein
MASIMHVHKYPKNIQPTYAFGQVIVGTPWTFRQVIVGTRGSTKAFNRPHHRRILLR